MNIAGYNIQPILLYLPDTQAWLDRWEAMKQHLEYCGVFGEVLHVPGVHAEKFGVLGTHPYELDNPGKGHIMGQKYTGSFLSMYVIYSICNHLPDSHFLIMEDDTRFSDGWYPKLENALKKIPSDFDWIFVGSCCAVDKRAEYLGDGLYKYPRTKQFPVNYPMGGNCMIVAKKAIKHILATQRDAYAPADISMALHSFQEMEVYSILPRICEQLNNEGLAQ